MKEKSIFFVCPLCHCNLTESNSLLECNSCHTIYPVVNDVPFFYYHKEIVDYILKTAVNETEINDKLEDLLQILEISKTPEVIKYCLPLSQAIHFFDRKSKNQILNESVEFLSRLPEWKLGHNENLYDIYTDVIKDTQDTKVLEIGVAIYGDTEKLFNESTIFSLDVSIPFILTKQLIKTHKPKQRENVFNICADGNKLPFADNYFDYICCFRVLHHIENIPNILNELKRVLKPNGFILIGGEPICYPITAYQKLTFGKKWRKKGINEQVFFIKEWKRFIEAAQLKIIKIHTNYQRIKSLKGLLKDIMYKLYLYRGNNLSLILKK